MYFWSRDVLINKGPRGTSLGVPWADTAWHPVEDNNACFGAERPGWESPQTEPDSHSVSLSLCGCHRRAAASGSPLVVTPQKHACLQGLETVSEQEEPVCGLYPRWRGHEGPAGGVILEGRWGWDGVKTPPLATKTPPLATQRQEGKINLK